LIPPGGPAFSIRRSLRQLRRACKTANRHRKKPNASGSAHGDGTAAEPVNLPLGRRESGSAPNPRQPGGQRLTYNRPVRGRVGVRVGGTRTAGVGEVRTPAWGIPEADLAAGPLFERFYLRDNARPPGAGAARAWALAIVKPPQPQAQARLRSRRQPALGRAAHLSPFLPAAAPPASVIFSDTTSLPSTSSLSIGTPHADGVNTGRRFRFAAQLPRCREQDR